MKNSQDNLSTWELFLGEITRNICPSKTSIEMQLLFLVERNVCSEKRFRALTAVRYMAAYEQAINEYLHPPSDFKQANIKAELIHFGSIFEGLLEIFLASQFRKNEITASLYDSWFPKNNNELLIHEDCLSKKLKNGRHQKLSFNASIDCFAAWNKHKNGDDSKLGDYARLMHSLREQRNDVHVDHMVYTGGVHEEHKLVEVREKWDGFVAMVNVRV